MFRPMYIVEASACFQQRPASRPPPSPVVPSSVRLSQRHARGYQCGQPCHYSPRAFHCHPPSSRIFRGGEYRRNCQFSQLLQLLTGSRILAQCGVPMRTYRLSASRLSSALSSPHGIIRHPNRSRAAAYEPRRGPSCYSLCGSGISFLKRSTCFGFSQSFDIGAR